jgi:DNA/RNA-binding domain of Phe-tRNA-synthetase-like protein
VSDAPLLEVDPSWRESHSGASFGILALRGVSNPPAHPDLEKLSAALEEDVRTRLGAAEREMLRAIPPLPAYAAYYKRWGQRYHVAMQLESVAQKGKSLPRVAALVEAMFIAELQSFLLTAGHDLDEVALPVRLGVGAGGSFRGPGDRELSVKSGDMFVADSDGRVLSAIITGPSDIARIGPATSAALFHVYAVPGVEPSLVATHLDAIERNVRLITPQAEVVGREIDTAD